MKGEWGIKRIKKMSEEMAMMMRLFAKKAGLV
jgi:hypothetical protein